MKMTENIFPEDLLVENKMIQYLEPKNKNFMVEFEKSYEVSMLDKLDLIRI
jgi:hypothetical protein